MKRKRSRSLLRFKRLSRVLLVAVLFVAGLGVMALGQAAYSGSPTPSPAVATELINVGQESSDGVWKFADDKLSQLVEQEVGPLRSYRRLSLGRAALSAILRQAPMESRAASDQRPILTLPSPDGTFLRFSIVESPILAPELAARFPEIKTYTARGIDDPTVTTRFDWTALGFHAIILSSKGTVLIEPSTLGDFENYIVYFQVSAVVDPAECAVTTDEQQSVLMKNSIAEQTTATPSNVTSGTNLRTYRLAAAATAEYTQAYGGGTVPGGLSAVTTTINLVNAIYERDVAIRLTLIGNNDAIIFTNSATDGYTSDNLTLLIGENQTKLDTVIGSANYDIGHVFDGRLLTGGAFSWLGQASIGSVCLNGSKARGVDIFRSVSPTSIYAYYSAAHEIGHQFGASHTFNTTSGSCGGQRIPATAYEPFNGSTIMAYRLACSPDDLASTDTYFHNASIEQIVNFTTVGGGSGCPVVSTTGNDPPTVDAGASFTIPMGTPFVLTATGSDPNGDSLSFGWEEFDLGTAAPPNTDDGSRPIFRSFLPTASPFRTFPRLQDILTGTPTNGESLPTTTRTMNFRVTARDNRAGGGGVNSDATQVNVRADAGPFTVTLPASATTWTTGSTQTVNWNVANTNSGAVNTANVRIALSTDGGVTFPIVLANNTPNDGAEVVAIPGTPAGGGTARVKVEAAGNIFFNISQGFTITGAANTIPTISSFSPGSGSPGTSVTVNGTNFINPSSVSFNGVNASFTVNSTISIAATVPAGATTGPISVTTASGTALSANSFVVLAGSNIQLSSATYAASENDLRVQISVSRTGDTSGAATVDFKTTDTDTFTVNCATKQGAAYGRCDFATVVGTVNFAAGETTKTFAVPIINDSYAEGNETFTVVLSNPTGATLGSASTATVTISDNETVDGANPILLTDDTGIAFFVRQHYLDFLGREPEPGEPWSNVLRNCGNQFNTDPNSPSAGCDRITVSGAFFGSPEFKDKGIYVIDFYRVSFNRLPTYAEFAQDLASVTGATAAETNARRAAFANNFVQRTEFVNIYGGMNNTTFVSTLMSGGQGQAYNLTSITTPDPATPDGPTKITLTTTDLISRLDAPTMTRAQVLRAIVQSDQISLNLEAVNAFVASQYYGYLRRTPDTGGFNGWVTYLRNNPTDFRTMVNGFMNSTEFRLRFGPS